MRVSFSLGPHQHLLSPVFLTSAILTGIHHINSLLISYSHLSRRQLRLNHLLYTCKRSLHILYLPFYTRRMRTILWLLCIHRNMKYWNNSLICNYSHSIHRLCPTMKTNILLRSNCHHKPTLSNPLHRD
uniref:Uncharacterized protein n=2 Tax=Canis lupus familiaris TaxID=9615 RepID=A0A8C0RIT2_CANLF